MNQTEQFSFSLNLFACLLCWFSFNIVSYEFLKSFRLRHVAYSECDVAHPTWGCSDLKQWHGRTSHSWGMTDQSFCRAVINNLFMPDHIMTSLLGPRARFSRGPQRKTWSSPTMWPSGVGSIWLSRGWPSILLEARGTIEHVHCV